MLPGFLLTTLLTLSPGQSEPAPMPQKLHAEGYRLNGNLPKPTEVALPLATSHCATCNQSPAQYPDGCGPGNCYGASCDTEPLGPPWIGWSDMSFVYYWFKPAPLGPLLTTTGGMQLNPNTADFRQGSGGSIAGGAWLNNAHTFGYGYSGILLEQRASYFSQASDGAGNPVLTRPFINALDNLPSNFFVSDPGRLAGTFSSGSGLRFAGGEFYGLMNVKYCGSKYLNLLAGFRYFDLDEYLELFQETTSLNGAPFTVAGVASPGPINIVDRFRTRNQFYGMEIGSQGRLTHSCLSFGVTTKIAVGNVHQTLDIAGQTQAAGAPPTQGGFYALSTNIGRLNYNRIAVVADLSAEFGIQLTEGSRLFVAYDFIYLNDVIRPGSQIDRIVNTRFVPSSASFGTASGPASPLRTNKHDDFYVYGLRCGYALQY